ncbi:hypothetical protein, conserved in T. vivax [Trypanosoma vivax Y486]|uniref:Trypanosome variant surface glycoprotein A-type N-terminal domain-containing protein n=1 Tax=Trypanosoma vivax (strain Y486) TaxID=1055687 RepID=F9WT63_TRYVY|nr:hypothetical protein, conserved in T. vivax [Trypanosoma vivax Y486]|eukprot:CCD20754.1 hypothetical protein, conserved in T. vivax [Trypanosoma vivax Y486]
MALRAACYIAALAIGVASRGAEGKAATTGPQVEGARALCAVVVELQGAARCAREVAVLGEQVGRNLDTMSATWDTGKRIVSALAETLEDEAARNATALAERLQAKAKAAGKALDEVHAATLQAREAQGALTATAAMGSEYIRTLASFISTNAGHATKTCLSSTDADSDGGRGTGGTKWSKWGDEGVDDYLAKVCPDLFSNTRKADTTNKTCEHATSLAAWTGTREALWNHAGGKPAEQGAPYEVADIGEEAADTDGDECPMLMAAASGKYGLALKTEHTKLHFAKLFELTFSSSDSGALALDAQHKINEEGTQTAAQLAAQIVKAKARVEEEHTKQKCTSRGRTKTCQALEDAKGETQDTVQQALELVAKTKQYDGQAAQPQNRKANTNMKTKTPEPDTAAQTTHATTQHEARADAATLPRHTLPLGTVATALARMTRK